MKLYIKFFIVFFVMTWSKPLTAQIDTIITKDNTVLSGEIKYLEKGVLVMKTSFSEKDFQIEWLEVKQFVSDREFRFVLSNGTRLLGSVSMDSNAFYAVIYDEKGPVYVLPQNIVHIKHIKSGSIFDVMNLALDVGYSFTRSNHLQQLNGSLRGDYYRQFWGIDLNINTVQSSQDDVDPTKRTDASFSFKVFMKNDYFSSINADYNNNIEQNLKLRSNYNITFGKFFIYTNRIYFNSALGLASNREVYFDTTQERISIESLISFQFNMFDVGDFNLFTDATFFPSITDKYRLRTSINLTLKYDLPRDFYIKGSLDFKYDTKPLADVAPEDYVITAGIGWEL